MDGIYPVSNYKNSLVRKFYSPTPQDALNKTLFRDKSDIPGPGAYKIFSEFGKYTTNQIISPSRSRTEI